MQITPGMIALVTGANGGSTVFISSISGKMALQGQSLYNATKFGMRGFALALREELRPRGVGVTTVFPGFIRDAGMFADSGVKLPAGPCADASPSTRRRSR